MIRRRDFITLLGGAAASWPVAARAQQSKLPVIGLLGLQQREMVLEAFRTGLAGAGYEAGRNVAIEYRSGERLRSLAVDLIKHQAAVIVTTGFQGPIRVAKATTSTVPIVFFYAGDPVADGFVASLNRPGGNITGVTTLSGDLAGKRLDLLHKMVPQAKTVGFLSGTPDYIAYEAQTSSMRAAARALGLELLPVECRSDADFEMAFSIFEEHHADALILGTFAFRNLNKVVELAASRKLPAIYAGRELVIGGGLMSYDSDAVAAFRQLGTQFVARILNGARPAELPVQQPTKFELVINLKTAKALGLTVPPSLLAIADEVIE
jgi:putative tryptophan/tyrosine transport system substrate-binding protein